jgi:hypothetical protein
MPDAIFAALSVFFILGPGAWQLTANARETKKARRSETLKTQAECSHNSASHPKSGSMKSVDISDDVTTV